MHNNNFMNAPLVRSDVRAISMTSWYVKTSNKPSHCLDEKKNENTRRVGGGKCQQRQIQQHKKSKNIKEKIREKEEKEEERKKIKDI